ncbi:MAG: hypothetical protein WCF30_13930 [Terracidiphilus sp.]
MGAINANLQPETVRLERSLHFHDRVLDGMILMAGRRFSIRYFPTEWLEASWRKSKTKGGE